MDMGTVLLIWCIGNRLYGKYVGLLSAGLVAVNPLHVWMSTRILTDVPLVLFIYLTLYFLVCRKNTLFYLFSTLSLATKYTAAPLYILPFVNKRTLLRSPRVWLVIYLSVVGTIICFITFGPIIENYWIAYFLGFFVLPDFKEMYRETFFFLDPVVCVFFFIGFGTALKNKYFSPMLVWVILFGTARFFYRGLLSGYLVTRCLFTLPFSCLLRMAG
jgi:4-amino-4-deoxy-L-arabinose transferase-like glycosyltransferase